MNIDGLVSGKSAEQLLRYIQEHCDCCETLSALRYDRAWVEDAEGYVASLSDVIRRWFEITK